MKSMNKKIAISLIGVLFHFAGLFAQSWPLEITVTIPPPYPTNLDAYIEYLEDGILEVTNLENNDIQAFLQITIQETSGLASASSDESLNPVLLSPGITIFTSSLINEVFENLTFDNVNTTGLTQDELTSILVGGQLPEGEYRLCVTAFDELGNPLSDNMMGCTTFEIYYGERPIIESPWDGENLEEAIPYLFSWSHIVNDPEVASRLEYIVKILDLTKNDITNIPLAMVDPSVPTIYEENVGSNFQISLIPQVDVFYESGHDYAVRVQVEDPDGILNFGSDTYSEIVTFSYDKEEEVEGIEIIIAAPEITSEEESFVFDEDNAVEIKWKHDFDNSNRSISYEAFLVDLTELDVEEISPEDIAGMDEHAWSSDGFQSVIILDGEVVGWEYEHSYAMVIRATSNNSLDSMTNGGFSQVYSFDIEEPEGEEEESIPLPAITAPLASPKTILNVDQLTLRWEHELDSIANPDHADYELYTSYTLQIIDMTDQGIPSPRVEHFMDPKFKKIKNEAITTATFSKIIKATVAVPPAAPKALFLPGHTYAIAINAEVDTTVSGEEVEAYENEGYSNIVVFSREAAATPIDTTPMPIITAPLHKTNINDDNIEVVWSHGLTPQDHAGYIAATRYRAQIIDLTTRNITVPKPTDFSSGEAKIWDQELTSFEVQQKKVNIRPMQSDSLVVGRNYAVAIRAMTADTDTLQYPNLGYSNIVTWTYSEELPLPYIITPEDKLITKTNPINIKWDHGLDTISNRVLYNSTVYKLIIKDLTATEAKATVADFENEGRFPSLYSKIITVKELQLPDSTGMPKTPAFSYIVGHKYGIAIKAFSQNFSFSYPNEGYGEIITFTHDEANSDDCPKSDCESAIPTLKTSIALSDTIIQRDTFLMGDIPFVIKTISGDTDGYAGTGEMIIGFIGAGARVKVSFDGVRVNASKQVFAGSAEADYDGSSGPIDDLAALGASGLLKVDHEKAKIMSAGLRSAGKLASALSGAAAVSLPIGFDKVEGNDTTIVGITQMSFTPQKNTLMAIMSLKNPDWGKYVPAFGAENVCFKNGGFAKQVKLFLAADYTIKLDSLDLILEAADGESSQGTYIELNCQGFKEAQITASLALDRKHLLPVDDEGDVIEDETVKAKITLSGTIQKQSNFLLSANVSPCEIPGLEGFSVAFQNGYYDGSDKSNPPNIVFPDGYEPSEAGKLWRGFWFEKFSITAPRDWGGGSMESRSRVELKNFILDETGISVVGKADNLLAIDKGAYEGFAISLDTISVEIIRNQFKSVSINGRMGLPILPADKHLAYVGNITKVDTTELPPPPPGKKQIRAEMSLTVSAPEASYYVPSLKSTLRLYQTTSILIKRDRIEQGIVAQIEGALAIGDTGGEVDDADDAASLDFPAIEMRGMKFNTMTKHDTSTITGKEPFFTPPTFGIVGVPNFGGQDTTQQAAPPTNPPANSPPAAPPAAEPKVNGFSIGLDEIVMKFGGEGNEDASADEVGNGTPVSITVGGHVHIVKSSTAGANKGFELSAEASITLGAVVNKIEEKFTFAFKSVEAARLDIESQMGPLGIDGFVEFYSNDEEFGAGVVGEVEITAPMIAVEVQARFGNVTNTSEENFSYFYLFGKVDLETPIALGSTGISLHRFLGGAYARMNVREGEELQTDPSLKYVPDNSIAFGLKAGVGFSFTRPELLFAQMAIELSITTSGGLGRVSLDGQMDMFQTDPLADKSGTEFEGIRLQANITVTAPEDGQLALTGSFRALANLAEGVLVGNQSGPDTEPYQVVSGGLNLIGDYFSVYLGTNDQRGSVKIGIPNAKLKGVEASGGITATFYMQAEVGATPDGVQSLTFVEVPVPDFIQTLLIQGQGNAFKPKDDLSNIPAKDYGQEAFKAMAGLQVNYELDVTFAIFYANFKAQLGFDASILPNKGIVCTNHGNAGIGFGPDQHYMKAQVYAGLEGGAGLDIDIGFYKGKIEIVYVYAAMLLQGGFPNPVYASGEAALGYSLLGGLIEGNIYFVVEVGEKCKEALFEPMAGIAFIEGINPDEGREGVSPFVKPLLSFQRKMGDYSFVKPNADPDNPGPGDMAHFKVALERFEVLDQSNNPLDFEMVEANDGLSAYIKVTSLEPNTTYNLVAEVKVSELKSGLWVEVSTENKVVTFTTGKMPDHMVWENVIDCYPFRDEEYYMIDHNKYNQGLIRHMHSRADLVAPFTPAGQQWHSKVVAEIYQVRANQSLPWVSEMTKISTSDVTYNAGYKVLVYDLPSENLTLNTASQVRVRRVWYQNPNYDVSSTDLENLTSSAVDNEDSYITFNRDGKSYANATEERPLDKTLCTYGFNTSMYRNIYDKLMTEGGSSLEFYNPYFPWYVYRFSGSEPLSEQEIGTRTIAESYSINKNSLFFQEDLSTHPSRGFAADYGGYKWHSSSQLCKTWPSMPNIKFLSTFNWYGAYHSSEFDFHDIRARQLYQTSYYDNNDILSLMNAVFPTVDDLKNLDLALARLYAARNNPKYPCHNYKWEGFNTSRIQIFGNTDYSYQRISNAQKYFLNNFKYGSRMNAKIKYSIPVFTTYPKDEIVRTIPLWWEKPTF